MLKKTTVKHGGKRKGAGRPKTKEDTVVMRIPVSLVDKVKMLINGDFNDIPGLVEHIDARNVKTDKKGNVKLIKATNLSKRKKK